MITEIEGRMTCTKCGYAWSAMLGDNEIPAVCDCSRSHRCDGCGKRFTEDKLAPISKISQRTSPGGTVPSGQCPDEDCGSLCFPVDETDAAYAEAQKLGLTGFDVDMGLTAAQNLDMAKHGFSANENHWAVMSAKQFVYNLAEPDSVGQSEYRAVYTLLADVADCVCIDYADDEQIQVLHSSLEELIKIASEIKRDLEKHC